ncbi:hypothetical protein MMC21_002050 [Puttea exsequens]|nr:hypothetical protein [Puttea exsequens]
MLSSSTSWITEQVNDDFTQPLLFYEKHPTRGLTKNPPLTFHLVHLRHFLPGHQVADTLIFRRPLSLGKQFPLQLIIQRPLRPPPSPKEQARIHANAKFLAQADILRFEILRIAEQAVQRGLVGVEELWTAYGRNVLEAFLVPPVQIPVMHRLGTIVMRAGEYERNSAECVGGAAQG